MRNIVMALVILGLASAAQAGKMATVSGDLSWTGQPTSDGSAKWPATLLISFDDTDDNLTLDASTVSLKSSAYSGVFLLKDDGMTSSSQRFFGDGEVDLTLTMNPLDDLTDSTIDDVTLAEFAWAHPDFNDVAPVSWLTMSGPLVVGIPEPGQVLTAAFVLAMGLILLGSRRIRPER
jgi:hypothetical protein